MKRTLTIIGMLATLTIGPGLSAGTSVDIGISADKDGITGFHLSIHQHYGVTSKSITIIKKERLPDDELTVAFFLAERTGASAHVLARLRMEGNSWMSIARRYNLTAEVFYIDLRFAGGPPHGKAYGHFKGKKRKHWRKLDLSNAEIINLVNLRFLSDHYGYSVAEIIIMRDEGHSFVKIGGKVRYKLKQKREKSQMAAAAKKGKVKSKGKHKGKGDPGHHK